MLKKTRFYIATLVIGILLLASSFVVHAMTEGFKSLEGVLLGVGAGLIGMSIANLVMKYYERKRPNFKKQNEIEFNDERNAQIRYRAQAKAGSILVWLLIAFIYLLILLDVPLWVTLVGVGVFSSYYILMMIFMNKYRKEM